MNESPASHSDGEVNGDLLKQLAYNEKMAELGKISAGVVHELNAPLSVIISASQLILREENVSDFVREMLGRISSESQRLSKLTRGLLNFSNQNETASEVDINLTVQFVLEFLGYEAARRGIVVQRDLDFHIPLVRLVDSQLKQVLLNIIMNALQAMEGKDGGLLGVRTFAFGPETVSISITDNGGGIPPELLDRIFERYFSTKSEGVGTCLGLFVTQRLVEGMSGSIDLRSEPGVGTTFVINLPAVE